MVIENVTAVDIVSQVGSVGKWVQAVGLVVVLWIFFQIVAFFFNLKRMREIDQIKKDMVRIEKKIDRALKN